MTEESRTRQRSMLQAGAAVLPNFLPPSDRQSQDKAITTCPETIL